MLPWGKCRLQSSGQQSQLLNDIKKTLLPLLRYIFKMKSFKFHVTKLTKTPNYLMKITLVPEQDRMNEIYVQTGIITELRKYLSNSTVMFNKYI